MAKNRRLGWYGACSLLVTVLAHAAMAQDTPPRENLKSLRDTLARTRGAISRDTGQRARRDLQRWNLSSTELDAEARGWLLEVQIYAALAVGDAREAADILSQAPELPNARQTLRLSWLVAGAAGDAELAQRTLEQLRRTGFASDTAITKRRARLARIGHPAPDQTIRTDSGDTIALRDRGGDVLVLDFWCLRDQPTKKQIAALRDLVRESERHGRIAFLGVNSDPPGKVDTARRFARKHDLVWPHYYEQDAKSPPLTNAAFGVASIPWTVLIDGEGNVRAVGTAMAPEFQYAVRAALAETLGTYAVVRPRKADGVEAPRPAVKAPPKKDEEQAKPADPPHHPEARRLLDQARLYLKTGRKRDARKLLEELIEKYPNTREAREARRMGLI